jgi:sortase (surface protein transpeptidase)
VILGHVDSHAGPGIFFDLSRLPRGAVVKVDRADGSTVTFRVTKVSRVSKTRFPTDLVYAPTLEPTLRLVTCGGSFDPSRRSYRDNVIAFASSA